MPGVWLPGTKKILKENTGKMKKLEESLEKYHETAGFLKSHMGTMIRVLGITFAQRLALFSVTYFVYRSLGLHGIGMYDLVMLQAVISVTVDMLPLPGGMGISEKLFSVLFVPVFPAGLLLPAMILSRGLSYYTELLLSALMTGTAHLVLGKN